MIPNKQFLFFFPILIWLMLVWPDLLNAQGSSDSLENEEIFIPPTQLKNSYIEISHANDWLTNNYDNWQTTNLNLFLPQKEKGTTFIELSKVRRFNLEDESAYINYSYPTKYGAAILELGRTTNADFLFRNLYGVGWNGILGNGYGYIVSYRQRNFSDSLSDMFSLTMEKYFSNYRIAYTNTQSSLDKQQLEQSHRLQLQWIPENNNRFGISYSTGKEPINLGLNQLSASDVEQLQIDGVYWIKDIGISAAIWHLKQGDFYTRKGAQIGLRLAF